MKQARKWSASIPIDGGMVVTGGQDGSGNTLKSSQIVLSDGSAVTNGPELPEPRYGHCMAYDKKHNVFFVTGGYYYKNPFNTAQLWKPHHQRWHATVWQFNNPEKFIYRLPLTKLTLGKK